MKNQQPNIQSNKRTHHQHHPSHIASFRKSLMICEELFSEESQAALERQFVESKPYRHVVMRPLCADDQMRTAQREVLEHLGASYKETDLFKLYQTADFANLRDGDELAAKIPALLRLRDELYSPRFRAHVERVTQCGALSERVDCAANVYMQVSAGLHSVCSAGLGSPLLVCACVRHVGTLRCRLRSKALLLRDRTC